MEQLRKKTTGESGNPGEFGHKTPTIDEVTLPDEAWEDDDWGAVPPTKRDVDEAYEAMMDARPSRQMYRGDWQRVNGGTGPTLGQHQAHMAERGRESDRYGQARARWQKMNDAWEASDKSQDAEDRAVRCWNCGAWYGEFDGRCPECGES